jgi:signal transduction histidine kinase
MRADGPKLFQGLDGSNATARDPEQRERIFDAFERLHTEVEFAGTGLGLATALHVARPHGGDVWAEGSPGDGAMFSFSLSL